MSGNADGWDNIFGAAEPGSVESTSADVPTLPAPKIERSAAERLTSGPSQATELVRLARARYSVVRGKDSKTYAVAHTRPGLAFGLRGDGGLRQQLAAGYFDDKSRAAAGGALSDALAVLEGDALNSAETKVSLRIGSHAGAVVIDLGTPDARAIVATAAGWQVEEKSPILFRRTKLTMALPTPTATGNLGGFQALLNVDQARFRLVVAWILGAFIADTPHPILALTGQQGTAKTTAANLILSLIDPSPASMQSQPRTEEDWAVSAFNAYGIGLDNISRMPPWFQDALCKAVTGAALVRRERYSDDSVSALQFRRPIVITSIDPGALQGDVADRLMLVDLEPIAAAKRLTDAEVSEAADRIRADTFGAILDLLVKVLERLPLVQLAEKPRMADFAMLLAALDEVTGWSTLGDYLQASQHAASDVVEGDSFASAVVNLVRRVGSLQGTAGDLLNRFSQDKPPADWPRTPRAVTAKLTRLTPALAAVGIQVERPTTRTNTGHFFTLIDATAALCVTCGLPLAPGTTTPLHPTCDMPIIEMEL